MNRMIDNPIPLTHLIPMFGFSPPSFLRFLATVLPLFAMFPASVMAAQEKARDRPNVLFIAIDDLRNDPGALGAAHAKTPQLDKFAATARPFSHHYVQVPICGASRLSLLRGTRPTKPVHINNNGIRATSSEWAERSLPGIPSWWFGGITAFSWASKRFGANIVSMSMPCALR